MTFRYFLSGSVVAILASLGVASSAIAIPTENVDQETLISQEVELEQNQQRVNATVASIDAQRGFIRVNLEEGATVGTSGVDTIYLGSADVSRLDIDLGEEVTVLYEDDQAVAIIRNDEIVQLNPSTELNPTTPDDGTGEGTTQTQPPVFDQQPDQIQQPQQPQQPMMQQPEPYTPQQRPTPAPQPTYQQQQTAPQTQQPEPVQGLW